MRNLFIFIWIFFVLSGMMSCQGPDNEDNPEIIPIVINNGGSSGLGSIYSFNDEPPQVKMVHEFTSDIPGRNPVTIVSDNKGNLIGATTYGAKYSKGGIFRINLQNDQLETLLVLPPNLMIGQLFYLKDNIYFIAYDLENKNRNLYGLNPGSKTISLISTVPTSKAIPIDDELYFIDGSVHHWIPGQLTINKLIDVKGDEIISLVPYKEGFLGLGITIEHGPPENPYRNPVGNFLFNWQPGDRGVEILNSWDGSDGSLSSWGNPGSSHLVIYKEYALFPIGTKIYSYQLGNGSVVATSLEQDINITGGLSNLIIVDDQLYAITEVDHQTRLIAIGLERPTLWLSEEKLVNPKGMISVNGKIFIATHGDLVRFGGGIIEFDPVAKSSTVVVDFGINSGESPLNEMVYLNSRFYGSTVKGGDNGRGTIFSLNSDLDDFKMLYSLSAKDGYEPVTIIPYKNSLFGITKRGGKEDVGTLFEYNPQTKSYRDVYEFSEEGCRFPKDMIISKNKLYIICSGGKFARGDMLIYDLENEDQSHIKTQIWKEPTEILLFKSDIYILARSSKSKQSEWFIYNPDTEDFSEAMISLPKGQLILMKNVFYYIEANNLLQWDPETDATRSLAEFESEELRFFMQQYDDHILISSWKDRVPEAASIYSYNTANGALVFLLEGKDSGAPDISSDYSETLPPTLKIIGQDIWVRDGPSTGAVIMKLNDDDECILLEKGKYEEIREMKDYWYKIRFEGKEGWVYGAQTNIRLEK